MSNELFAFSAEDLDQLRRDLHKVTNLREDQDPQSSFLITEAQQAGKPKTIYLAYPPKDQYIPKMDTSGDVPVPGALECCIYILDYGDDPTNPENNQLLPLDFGKDDEDALIHERHWVYNPYEIDGDTNTYFQVYRSTKGFFFCEKPSGNNPDSTTTTLGPDDPNNTPDPNTNSCDGKCKYIWNDTTKIWVLDEDNCSGAPTTTSTTTLGPVTSTTSTTLCPCPVLEDSTTTTEDCNSSNCIYVCIAGSWNLQTDNCEGDCECPSFSGSCSFTDTGTTTPIPCESSVTTTTADANCICRPPQFCGTNDGDCVDTYCRPDDGSGETTPDCGQTTTTCDCNTTTTGTPDPNNTTPDPSTNCSDGCVWTSVPSGGGGWYWHLVENNCSWNCPCYAPSQYPDPCVEAGSPCVPTLPPDPPTPFCTGYCKYIYSAALNRWIWTEDKCRHSYYNNCYCIPPTGDAEDCAEVKVACLGTTTTHGPCHDCYTSTTSTTTTGDPCDTDACEWSWDGAAWTKDSDPCPGDCPCGDPPNVGDDLCEVAFTNCGTKPTTTIDPTRGSCCYYTSGPDPQLLCKNTTEDDCDGVFTPQVSCIDNDCSGGSSTPPPAGACCYGVGQANCIEVPQDQCSALSGYFWGTGVLCSSVTCPTTTTSTTTTTTGGPVACCLPVADANFCIEVTAADCIRRYGGQVFGSSCDPNPCPGGGTTTTTPDPSTTTTTTDGPFTCGERDCQMVCEDGVWVNDPDQCNSIVPGQCTCLGPGGSPGGPSVACLTEGTTYSTKCTYFTP